MKPLIINQEKPILLSSKGDVIKVVLYIKLLLKGFTPFDNDLEILSELFQFGGYHNDTEKKDFYNVLITKNLRKSTDSINNKITEFAEKGILERYKKNCVRFNEDFLPNLRESFSQVGFISKITHAV